MKNQIQILIVEDEMIITTNISLQLSHLGYEVIGIISRAEEVLPFIREHQPRWDCMEKIIYRLPKLIKYQI